MEPEDQATGEVAEPHGESNPLKSNLDSSEAMVVGEDGALLGIVTVRGLLGQLAVLRANPQFIS